MPSRDADRQAFVETLVGHDVPVGNATRDHGEAAAQTQPYSRQPDVGAAGPHRQNVPTGLLPTAELAGRRRCFCHWSRRGTYREGWLPACPLLLVTRGREVPVVLCRPAPRASPAPADRAKGADDLRRDHSGPQT